MLNIYLFQAKKKYSANTYIQIYIQEPIIDKKLKHPLSFLLRITFKIATSTTTMNKGDTASFEISSEKGISISLSSTILPLT